MARELTPLSEAQLFRAYGMGRHERRQFDDPDGYGVGCSCGKAWGHEMRHQHTPSDPEPGCEYCEEAAK